MEITCNEGTLKILVWKAILALEDGLVMSFVMLSYSIVSDRVTSDICEAVVNT